MTMNDNQLENNNDELQQKEQVAESVQDQQEESIDWYNWEDEQTGFEFHGLGFVVMAMMLVNAWVKPSGFVFYACIGLVVLVHELGHAIAGLSFKCSIKSVQVFFLSCISYKASADPDAPAWKRIKWSIGALPFGGVTIFDENDPETGQYGMMCKPLWQQFVISSAGVAMNLLLFAVLYVVATLIPYGNAYVMVYSCARLSLVLAVLNLIPVCPLDGGAMLMQLLQMVTGHKFSAQFLAAYNRIGMILVFVFFFLITRWQDELFSVLFSLI